MASLFPFVAGRSWVGDLLASLRIQLALVALICGLAAAMRRGWVVALCAVVAVAANAAAVERVYLGQRVAPSGSARLTIGHVNMQGRPGDVAALGAALRARRPAVFVVLEPDVTFVRSLGGGVAGYRAYRRADSSGTRVLVLSRVPLRLAPTGAALPPASAAFDISFAGRVLHVLALHAVSPLSPARHRLRDSQLSAAKAWVLAEHGPVVVLGDLNTVPWSAALHDLERDAYLASSSDGFGLQASWPSLAGFAGLPIDQLLTSRDLTPTRRQTRGGFGSSHHSLWVELATTHRIA